MGSTVTASNGVALPIDSLSAAFAYNTTFLASKTVSYAGNKYVQTSLNDGTNITYTSNYQPVFTSALVVLSAAQVLAAYATPQLILPFPVTSPATSLIIPVSWSLAVTVSTAFAGGGNAVLQFGNTAHGAGTIAIASNIPAADITSATTAAFSGAGILANNAVANTGIYFSNLTAAFTGGAGSTLGITLNYLILNPVVS